MVRIIPSIRDSSEKTGYPAAALVKKLGTEERGKIEYRKGRGSQGLPKVHPQVSLYCSPFSCLRGAYSVRRVILGLVLYK